MREQRPYGSVRGASSNARPYRDPFSPPSPSPKNKGLLTPFPPLFLRVLYHNLC